MTLCHTREHDVSDLVIIVPKMV